MEVSALRDRLGTFAERLNAIDFSWIEDPRKYDDAIRATISHAPVEKFPSMTDKGVSENFPTISMMRAYVAREMIGKLTHVLDDPSIATGSALCFHGSLTVYDQGAGTLTMLSDIVNIAKGLSAPAINPVQIRHTCLNYILTDLRVAVEEAKKIVKTAIKSIPEPEIRPVFSFIMNAASTWFSFRDDAIAKSCTRTAAAISMVTPDVELSFPLNRELAWGELDMGRFYKSLERGLQNAGINPPGTRASPERKGTRW
jgi:hypothetical protein